MQLGELQSQLKRFEQRGVSVVAVSVDPPPHSRALIRRLRLQLSVASDEQQRVQKAYGVQNPDTRELALHAVFLVDESRRVFYRKVASRRPKSQELLDAIDYHADRYPAGDKALAYEGTPVAYPRNNFQALLEVAANAGLPGDLAPEVFTPVLNYRREGRLDDATIAYGVIMRDLTGRYSEAELLGVAAWLSVEVTALPGQALTAGAELNRLLMSQRRLRESESPDGAELASVHQEIDSIRDDIRRHADSWRLRALKTTLRGYREQSLAALR